MLWGSMVFVAEGMVIIVGFATQKEKEEHAKTIKYIFSMVFRLTVLV